MSESGLETRRDGARWPRRGRLPWGLGCASWRHRNECADKIPQNSFPGWDVLVNGKHYDALQAATRTLWEIKTDNFDTYTEDLQEIVIRSQVPMLLRERDLARACGFDFRVGVRSATHKAELESAAPGLRGLVVVMNWC